MECTEARLGLYALLDNELDIAQNLDLLSHLEDCPACQQECELETRLKTLLQEQLSGITPSPDLWRKVVQRIEQEAESDRQRGLTVRRLWPQVRLSHVAVAALVLVVVGLLSLFVGMPRGTPTLLVEDLITDHHRAISRPDGPVEFSATDAAAIVTRFRARFAVSAAVPVLAHVDARLLGGSFCQLRQTRGIRFTYALASGRTVSLYYLQQAETLPRTRLHAEVFSARQFPELAMVLWGGTHHLYALVADLPPETLQQLVAHVDGV
jgi:anti-sigma factor RsiW